MDAHGDTFVAVDDRVSGSQIDIVTSKYDATGQLLWSHRFGGGQLSHHVTALAPDQHGAVYVAGLAPAGTGFTFGLLLKLDANGNTLWTTTWPGAFGVEVFADLAVDHAGYVVVTGYEMLGPASDSFTVKYTAGGQFLWVQTWNSAANDTDVAKRVSVDSTNNVLVGIESVGVASRFDLVVVKYDPNGQLLWSQSYDGGGNQDERLEDLAVGPNDEVILTGGTKATGYLITSDYITLKYDAGGTLAWARRYDGVDHAHDRANALAVDLFGNVFVTGEANSVASGTIADGVTLKYDPAGNLLWERMLTSTHPVQALDLTVDALGGPIVVGSTYVQNGTQWDKDQLVASYDADGGLSWSATWDAPANSSLETSSSVATAPGGHVSTVTQSSGGAFAVAVVDFSPPCTGLFTTYCTGKVNSLGCTPSIHLQGVPNAAGTGTAMLTVTGMVAQKPSLYLHGTHEPQALPFHGGFLCVAPPLKRHPLTSSGGTAGQCDGTLPDDLNAYIASGADPALVAGTLIWIQAWSRDPQAPFGDALSDALLTRICP